MCLNSAVVLKTSGVGCPLEWQVVNYFSITGRGLDCCFLSFYSFEVLINCFLFELVIFPWCSWKSSIIFHDRWCRLEEKRRFSFLMVHHTTCQTMACKTLLEHNASLIFISWIAEMWRNIIKQTSLKSIEGALRYRQLKIIKNSVFSAKSATYTEAP